MAGRLLFRVAMYRALVMSAVLLVGCVTDDSSPTPQEASALDAWAAASDGKADLPGSYSELVAWFTNFYRNTLSAVWGNQEHPTSSDAAISRIRALMAQGGKTPETALFKTTVQRLRFSDVADHSEIDIVLPTKQVVRLIGDPKGAGVYFDTQLFETALAPALCLDWDELQTAVATSYQPGAYGLDFVCHNITERVLRALDIGSSQFSAQIHAYSIARYVWGPVLPSFNSANPASWPESRACN